MNYLENNPRFLNTVLLSGSFSDQLDAISKAGFSGIELWQQDVGNTAQPVIDALTQHALSITDYQVLLNFDGAVGEERQKKYQEAEKMLSMAATLGAKMILVAANTAECRAEDIVPDLTWLCAQAEKLGIRVAYEGMAWSTVINRCDLAWDIIQQVNASNLGLVIDAFHIYAKQRTIADLEGIPAEKIYLLQLSDLTIQQPIAEIKQVARHARLLPGEGNFPLADLLAYLDRLGYSGPVGLEVFNDSYHQDNCHFTAKRAMQALESVLAR